MITRLKPTECMTYWNRSQGDVKLDSNPGRLNALPLYSCSMITSLCLFVCACVCDCFRAYMNQCAKKSEVWSVWQLTGEKLYFVHYPGRIPSGICWVDGFWIHPLWCHFTQKVKIFQVSLTYCKAEWLQINVINHSFFHTTWCKFIFLRIWWVRIENRTINYFFVPDYWRCGFPVKSTAFCSF